MNFKDETRLDGGIKLKDNEDIFAVLIGIHKEVADLDICCEHLDELASLAHTFGLTKLQKVPCRMQKIKASTFLHSKKIEEIADLLKAQKGQLVIFDEEISPAQQRNLEKILRVAVMDRTELILEIFAQRAQTKEAQLQIELARTTYAFPRLKRLWSHLSRQRASGGYLKGEGEKQIEIDRRLLKERFKRLSKDLQKVQIYRQTQGHARRRSGIPTFAIIGYTNAGKSTLLNALTQANVLVENKLFATLDPTTRKFILPNKQEVLLTDTVGFIRKLPHTLIAAFRSTLEIALHDDVLIHLIDVSHPLAEEHAKTTRTLLKELNAKEDAIITVLNKIDCCNHPQIIDRLRMSYSKVVLISAKKMTNFNELAQMMMDELAEKRRIVKLRIPQSEYALVTTLRREGNVLYEEYEENDVILRAEIPIKLFNLFEGYLSAD
ncbi:MAG: GTPase HflX [Chlamydiales bacterium]